MNIDDRLVEIDKLLDEYANKIGIGVLTNPEISQYLNLSQTELKRLSSEELGEISSQIYRLSSYIQVELGKHTAKLNWCNKYLDYIVSNEIEQVGTKYTPYNIRKLLVIKQNDVAQKLNKLTSEISLYVDELNNMPYSLRAYAMSLEKLQQTKKHA